MELVLRPLASAGPGEGDVEIVERKGLGHPDTICDHLAEGLSAALCRRYLREFGTVLHHNVDKVLLSAGQSRPAFGGGEVLEPIDIYFAGRATTQVEGRRLPVEDIVAEEAIAWLAKNLHALDPAAHVRTHCLVRPGSGELADLFARRQTAGFWPANDTSCGVGYAPLSRLERLVLALEHRLNGWGGEGRNPERGEDIKVMAVRRGGELELTVACAFVGGFLEDLAAYRAAKAALLADVRTIADDEGWPGAAVHVNAADGDDARSVYLTVTGTSAEAGDDGQVGRGNRANGLITPGRPMSMEALAGKNPVSHVGKLYNLLAGRIAAAVVAQIPEIAAAQCMLVSRIGQPVERPQVADVAVFAEGSRSTDRFRAPVEAVVAAELDGLGDLSDRIIAGEVAVC